MSACLDIDRERESVFSPFPQTDAAPSLSSSSVTKAPSADTPKTHFVIVREDLPKGVLAAHVAHAAGESGPAPPGSIAVVLGVTNEAELLAIDARLTARGVPHVLIYENAGPYDGQSTAIGVHPTHDRKTVGKAVSSLRLVR
jgi:peptidyl-tRNA hydrolase